jgi:hypothetical protein
MLVLKVTARTSRSSGRRARSVDGNPNFAWSTRVSMWNALGLYSEYDFQKEASRKPEPLDEKLDTNIPTKPVYSATAIG